MEISFKIKSKTLYNLIVIFLAILNSVLVFQVLKMAFPLNYIECILVGLLMGSLFSDINKHISYVINSQYLELFFLRNYYHNYMYAKFIDYSFDRALQETGEAHLFLIWERNLAEKFSDTDIYYEDRYY